MSLEIKQLNPKGSLALTDQFAINNVPGGDVDNNVTGQDIKDLIIPTIVVFIPCTMEIPEGIVAFPDIRALATAVAKVSGMVLPDITASTINWKCKLPDAIDPVPDAKVRITIMTRNATAGAVNLTVSTRASGAGESIDLALASETPSNETMPATNNTLAIYEQSITIDPTSGDFITGQITRNPADAGDTYGGEIQIVSIEYIATRDI